MLAQWWLRVSSISRVRAAPMESCWRAVRFNIAAPVACKETPTRGRPQFLLRAVFHPDKAVDSWCVIASAQRVIGIQRVIHTGEQAPLGGHAVVRAYIKESVAIELAGVGAIGIAFSGADQRGADVPGAQGFGNIQRAVVLRPVGQRLASSLILGVLPVVAGLEAQARQFGSACQCQAFQGGAADVLHGGGGGEGVDVDDQILYPVAIGGGAQAVCALLIAQPQLKIAALFRLEVWVALEKSGHRVIQ